MQSRYQPSPTLVILSVALLIVVASWLLPTSHAQGQVQVTAADPAASEQGTINLNVKVTGKGFKNGAKAKWFVTGTTDTGGVTVNSTTFVSSSEVTANITVADAATIANFDIQVTNSDGRGGKGTELFAVTAKGQGQTSCGSDVTNLSASIFKYTDATNTTTYNLQPDQTYADGSPVPYVTGKVRNSNILAQFQINNCTYDFTLSTGSSRFMTYKFPDGSPLGTSVNFGFFNMDRVASVPVTDGGSAFLNWCNTATDNYAGCGVDANGYFVRRAYGSTLDSQSRYHLRFNYSPFDIGTGLTLAVGTAYVKVYHTDANTWMMMPAVVPPPPSVTGTDGEWSALIDNSIPAVINYQKIPFKILVKKL